MWALLGVELFGCFVCTLYLFHIYVPFRRFSFLVNFTIFLGYFCSMSTIALIPSDLIATQSLACREGTADEECRDWTDIDPDLFYPIWSFLFFASALHTWVVVPFIQGYVESGHFTFWDRCKYSLRVTFLFYFACIVGLIILVSYLLFTQGLSTEGMQGVLAAMTNTSGLLLLFALLGYGLVEYPRSIWFQSSRSNWLMLCYWRVSSFQDEMDEAKAELVNVLRIVKLLQDKITESHPYRFCYDQLVAASPEDALKAARPETKQDIIRKFSDPSKITKAELSDVMRKLQVSLQNYLRFKRQYEDHLQLAMHAEEVDSLSNRSVRLFADLAKFSKDGEKPAPNSFAYYKAMSRAYWEVRVRPWFLRFVTFLLVLLTFAVIWCESTVFAEDGSNLSIFAIALNHARSILSYHFLSLIPLSYITLCAYWSLLQLRLFNFYVLLPGQENDANSLLFSSTYLFRLAMPAAYNFLFVVNEYQDTSLAKVMGTMDVIPLFGKTFNLYFPIILIFLCVVFFFNLSSKILACCHVERFAMVRKEIQNDVVEMGKLIVNREKRRLEHESNKKRRNQIIRKQDIGANIFSAPANRDQDIEAESSGSAPLVAKAEASSITSKVSQFFSTPKTTREVEMTSRSAAILASMEKDEEPENEKKHASSLRATLGLAPKSNQATSQNPPAVPRPVDKPKTEEYQFTSSAKPTTTKPDTSVTSRLFHASATPTTKAVGQEAEAPKASMSSRMAASLSDATAKISKPNTDERSPYHAGKQQKVSSTSTSTSSSTSSAARQQGRGSILGDEPETSNTAQPSWARFNPFVGGDASPPTSSSSKPSSVFPSAPSSSSSATSAPRSGDDKKGWPAFGMKQSQPGSTSSQPPSTSSTSSSTVFSFMKQSQPGSTSSQPPSTSSTSSSTVFSFMKQPTQESAPKSLSSADTRTQLSSMLGISTRKDAPAPASSKSSAGAKMQDLFKNFGVDDDDDF
eukprot:TRINITY_DN7815_c0_g1_i1.p1 TRINITY_DN7815_c0_g1~~TRINITY_DN7815_c0_g1_i1.p1  ORF type:complete len:971 (-),score=207.14 TRINITY_DN7815_c0_g1_i1:218-3130(-)